MRIDELAQREDFWGIFIATVRQLWSEMLGHPVHVSRGPSGPGQLWCVHPLLSAVFSEAPSRQVRHHLRDSFRFTAVPWRMVPQLVLGTGLAMPLGLRLTSRGAFRVEPPIPYADDTLILPGNRRIRHFAFRTGVSRVQIKLGFDRSAIEAEVQLRAGQRPGPFIPITRHADDKTWFEEPIFSGYSLARCPPWLSRKRLAGRAAAALETWSASFEPRRLDADSAVAELMMSLAARAAALPQLGLEPKLAGLATALARRARTFGDIVVLPSHGDFQPGNVLIDRAGGEIRIVDWEFQAARAQNYDRLVFGLASRSPAGLGQRMLRFVHGREAAPTLGTFPRDRRWRAARCAFFALEELEWRLSGCDGAPFSAAPADLQLMMSELEAFNRQL